MAIGSLAAAVDRGSLLSLTVQRLDGYFSLIRR